MGRDSSLRDLGFVLRWAPPPACRVQGVYWLPRRPFPLFLFLYLPALAGPVTSPFFFPVQVRLAQAGSGQDREAAERLASDAQLQRTLPALFSLDSFLGRAGL